MMDVTTREFRFLLRQKTRHTTLYTEMIPADALLHGRGADFLAHDEPTPPVLQLGSADPVKVALAGDRAKAAGYTTVNINAGCPSPKVKSGGFGVFLMGEKNVAAEMVRRLKEAGLSVTVKHRLGVDRYDEAALYDFCAALIQAGVDGLIVHARIALSRGISPAQNRDIPPLDYAAVYRLKERFPDLPVIINGGITAKEAVLKHLQKVDGVMLGRAVARNPGMVRSWDSDYFGGEEQSDDGWSLAGDYLRKRHQAGRPAGILCRAVMEWMHGRPGGKRFRQILSDSRMPFLERWEQALTVVRTSTEHSEYLDDWTESKQIATVVAEEIPDD